MQELTKNPTFPSWYLRMQLMQLTNYVNDTKYKLWMLINWNDIFQVDGVTLAIKYNVH